MASSMMLKSIPRPEFTVYRDLTCLERAQRTIEVISHPRDYQRSFKLLIEVTRAKMFGRGFYKEYYDAGRVTSIFQFVQGTTAKTTFEFTTTKIIRKGRIIALHGAIGDWYVGRRLIDPINMIRGDTFHPSWSFNA